jgi:exosortase
MRAKKTVIILLIVTLLSLLYSRTFLWLVSSWLNHPYYAHGFLVPLVSGFIVWKGRHQLEQNKQVPASILIITLWLSLHIVGLIFYFDFLSAVSFLVVLSGLSLYFWGIGGLKSLLFPICFLILMIPFPFLDRVGNWMQSLSIQWSASIIGGMGIPATTTGAAICIGGTAFTIGIPCSGINTLISLLSIGILFCYFFRGHPYKKILLLMSIVPIAFLTNLFRIILILVMADYYGTEMAMRFFHNYSSIVLFGTASLCLVCFGWLLKFSFRGAFR